MKCAHRSRVPIISFIAITLPLVQAQLHYTVQDLGTLNGPVNEAYDLSPDNQVVGRVLDPSLAAKAVFWSRGRVVNLNGSLPAPGEARGISSNGLIAGSLGNFGILWQNGGSVPLIPLAGHIASRAYDVNASGTVIGWSINSVGDATAMRWTGGVRTQLDANHSWAFAINDRGQIIGRRDISTGRQARLWQDGRAVTLPGLGGNFASATNISPRGTIITGGACLPLNAQTCGMYSVVWLGPGHIIVILSTFPGALEQNVWAANDRGILVGNAAFDFEGLDSRAIIWRLPNLMPVDLNTLIAPTSGWRIDNAQAVNQFGWIAGSGTHNGLPGRRAVLLRPVSPADITGDATVNDDDISAIRFARGACPAASSCPADLDGDGHVDDEDLRRVMLK
jgi:uncharacterized membrane protein